MLAGAAGFEPANAGAKSRREWLVFASLLRNGELPHSNINDLEFLRGMDSKGRPHDTDPLT